MQSFLLLLSLLTAVLQCYSFSLGDILTAICLFMCRQVFVIENLVPECYAT